MNKLSTFLRAGLAAGAFGSALLTTGCGSMSTGASPSAAPTPMMAVQSLRATLSSAAEVPSISSDASGSLEASFDRASSVLRWKLSYTGLSGPATMAHFHGPAMPGANAGVAVPIPNVASPVEGQATLTPAQVADLMAGKWYVNVHTAKHPSGEIRGQVLTN